MASERRFGLSSLGGLAGQGMLAPGMKPREHFASLQAAGVDVAAATALSAIGPSVAVLVGRDPEGSGAGSVS